jgi:Tol biopolymer transport system component
VTFGGNNDYPVWTRDSRTIYFSGSQDGKFGIYRAPVDGSAKPVLVMPTNVQVLLESVAPDGRSLVYVESDKAPPHIMVLELNTDGSAGKPHPLHDGGTAMELQAQISPDGKWIAYASSESGTAEIYAQSFPVPAGKIRVSHDGGQRPRWSRDGKELFYWAGTPMARLMSVSVTPGAKLDLSQPKQVFQRLVGTTFDVTPDANRFLIELATNSSGSVLAVVTNWFDELAHRAPAKK